MYFSTAFFPLLAALSTIATATLEIDTPPNDLSVSDKYEVKWSSESDYILELDLVQNTGNGWTSKQRIFQDERYEAGNNSYLWKVPNVDSSQQYALWLSGENVDDTSTGYADLTPWVFIAGGTLVSGSNTTLTRGAIGGIAVAAIVVVAAIVGCVFFLIRRRRAAAKKARVLDMAQQPAEMRGSMDSIAVEKERAKLAEKGLSA